MTMQRLLFVLKKREAVWGNYSYSLSSGLLNSVSFLVEMLVSYGIDAKLVEVDDNNAIDREVSAYRPTHCIIEAFWVVPEKFDVLMPLHPGVHWIVRNHSEVPFLANEGIAFGWIAGYVKRGVEVMCNAPRAFSDVRSVVRMVGGNERLVSFGPNHYPFMAGGRVRQHLDRDAETVNIGCFGAVRPLKNHMAQAIAAVSFARRHGKKLAFHVNSRRVEGGGDPIVKNLRNFFEECRDAELIEHDWMPHAEFLELVSQMAMVLQVSFSETFNIVAADAVSQSVPVIVSPEIPWIGSYAHADPTSIPSIAAAMDRAWTGNVGAWLAQQRRDLTAYCGETEREWLARFPAPAAA